MTIHIRHCCRTFATTHGIVTCRADDSRSRQRIPILVFHNAENVARFRGQVLSSYSPHIDNIATDYIGQGQTIQQGLHRPINSLVLYCRRHAEALYVVIDITELVVGGFLQSRKSRRQRLVSESHSYPAILSRQR